MHGEKARQKQHKNGTCCFEQIIEATPPQKKNTCCIAT